MSDELAVRLTEFVRYWDYVERRLKEVENLRGEAFIPALNEMRYAGRHFTEAWGVYAKRGYSNMHSQEIERLLIIAENHLQRARFDITDGACSFMHESIVAMREAYGLYRIVQYYPAFVPFSRKLDAANEIIAQSRETRDERTDKYLSIETEYLPELTSVYDDLRYAEHELLKAKVEEEARERQADIARRANERHKRFVTITTIFLVVAALISLPPLWEYALKGWLGAMLSGSQPKASTHLATGSDKTMPQTK